MKNYEDIFKYIVSKNVNLELKDISGMTPLHYTCKSNSLEIFKILIEKNVDIN